MHSGLAGSLLAVKQSDMERLTIGSDHWRLRAEECRKLAEHLDEPAKTRMLEVAQSYEKLAALAEKKWVTPQD
jgi:hypothetical protein